MKKKVKYNNPKVVGVTGGIGSGQTTVCDIFKRLGCKVINVDEKAKQVIKKNKTVQNEIKKEYGNKVFYRDGNLNRKLLASIVFEDENKTQTLNKIIHPRMVADVVEEMESARFSGRYPLIIVDAALIYEISIEKLFDAVIVVFSNQNQRIKRVMQRDAVRKEEILARMDRQIPLAEKQKWSDYVIDNRGEIADLEKQVQKVFDDLVD
jgi:dephospho-CoA kinase